MSSKKKKGKLNKPVKNKTFWTRQNIILLCFVIVLATAAIYYFLIRKTEPQFVKGGEVTFIKSRTNEKVKRIDVEVANTPATRDQGLMYRSHMADSLGMLFIFPDESREAFWMKNTILPLDIMFVDSKGVIDTIYRHTVPFDTSSLPSRRKVQFVVEVNAGFSDKYGIREGDLISFNTIKK